MDDQPGPSSRSDPMTSQSMMYNQNDPQTWISQDYSLENVITPLDDDVKFVPKRKRKYFQYTSTSKAFYDNGDRDDSLGASIDPSMDHNQIPQSSHSNNMTPMPAQASQKRKVIPYDVRKLIKDFWPSRKRRFESMTEPDFKQYIRHMELPMARVKKIMKIDDDVKQQMISQDAPLFLSAAAEIFIQEITLKSWAIVEEGRRKTLQKCDIASAVAREEHFDFLIDIVPREEARKYQMNPLYEQEMAVEPQQMQYVLADCDSMGNNVYQLDNGQIIQATAIGQPIPISDPNLPNGGIDITQLPPGFQIVQMPSNM